MDYQKIAIIGGGNLGSAIAQGLLKSGFSKPGDITITKRNTSTLAHLAAQGVQVHSDNQKAIAESEVIVVALKPYNVKEILSELKDAFNPQKHILISVVTGVLLHELDNITVANLPLFRAMPNTAIAIQESMTCICHQYGTQEQVAFVEKMFNQLGVTVSIDEKLMDAATVLGACGIAYALRFIRANIQGGIEIGFDARTANLIAAQTVKGAAELLIRENRHPEEEIDKVTTPKGCTIAGLNEMEHQGFSSSLIKGITASYNKIVKG
ncbi:pyrroline-5-carboxylate reductase [Chitinophaga skermanii]|uniref:Pyrroline-5-carboxylate reductase n=1 Tax=Chitinophaga skermanii TaxID=331697 RepID=A0A327QBC1_9BACT|nr:pyrroline-5-carboxylate reductase [Chitinophaga skermanii]RAJ01581.1 pyrroline-5-carboxylate reductase [Chitinophaga skermanii]